MKEANDVGRALVRASEMMADARHRAFHDSLTGLCNRALFDELLGQQLETAQRNQGSLAVLAIDLDGFKEVNDRYGHGAGDAVLKAAAERMRSCLRGSDTAARVGGDEFLVLLSSGDLSKDTATAVAVKLNEALSLPFPNIALGVGASLGLAMYPQSGASARVLVEAADAALYQAKRAGKRRVVLDEKLDGDPEVA